MNEGIRGLYKGLSANLIGVTPEKAIKLAVNDACRFYFARKLNTTSEDLPVTYGMACGAIAGLCQVIATNPMEIVKIQMQLNSFACKHSNANRISLSEVIRSLGIRGIYRGSFSTLCRDIPFSVLFFQSFASLKTISKNRNDSSPQPFKTLLAGMLAGGISAFLVTPMDGKSIVTALIYLLVVKTRLQSPTNHGNLSMLSVYRYKVYLFMNLVGKSLLLMDSEVSFMEQLSDA